MSQLPGIRDDLQRFRGLVTKEGLPLRFIETTDQLKKKFRDAIMGDCFCIFVQNVSDQESFFARPPLSLDHLRGPS